MVNIRFPASAADRDPNCRERYTTDMQGWRKVLITAGWTFVAAAAGFVALGAWAIAPFSSESSFSPRTAVWLARAPFAERIVVGDSRVQNARTPASSMLVGYGGATFTDLERMTRTLCSLSDAPITIALGVNDTKPGFADLEATRAAMDRMILECGADRMRFAQIWPTDPDVPSAGRDYDLEMIAMLNEYMLDLERDSGVAVLESPNLAGHTTDGVHFEPEVSKSYIELLDGPFQSPPRQ